MKWDKATRGRSKLGQWHKGNLPFVLATAILDPIVASQSSNQFSGQSSSKTPRNVNNTRGGSQAKQQYQSSALSDEALVLPSSFSDRQVLPVVSLSVPPWWVIISLLLSSLRCCVLNRRACKATRWIWDIAKIEAEEEMGALVRSLPLSKLGLCPSIPSLLFCLSWRVGMSGGMTSLSGCIKLGCLL
eukprot:g6474.t1